MKLQHNLFEKKKKKTLKIHIYPFKTWNYIAIQERNTNKKVHGFSSYNLREKLLGSMTLGLNVLELHFVMLANHDQNV